MAKEDYKKAVDAAKAKGRLPPSEPDSIEKFVGQYMFADVTDERVKAKRVAAFLQEYSPEERYISAAELVVRLKDRWPEHVR